MLFLIFLKIIAVLLASVLVAITAMLSFFMLMVIKKVLFDKKTLMCAIGSTCKRVGLPMEKKDSTIWGENLSDDEYSQYVKGFDDVP